MYCTVSLDNQLNVNSVLCCSVPSIAAGFPHNYEPETESETTT